MAETIDDKLREIFLAVLELPQNTNVLLIDQDAEARWDSLAHVTLIAAIESEFNVAIDISQSMELTSYTAVRDMLGKAGL